EMVDPKDGYTTILRRQSHQSRALDRGITKLHNQRSAGSISIDAKASCGPLLSLYRDSPLSPSPPDPRRRNHGAERAGPSHPSENLGRGSLLPQLFPDPRSLGQPALLVTVAWLLPSDGKCAVGSGGRRVEDEGIGICAVCDHIFLVSHPVASFRRVAIRKLSPIQDSCSGCHRMRVNFVCRDEFG